MDKNSVEIINLRRRVEAQREEIKRLLDEKFALIPCDACAHRTGAEVCKTCPAVGRVTECELCRVDV